ncbi:hypothetical protein CISIN_1g033130mg [Citrus sinensis]|uniref:Uncharacterized protein n=1 Tax=Citrus sinensis TaxID=2711 RepID=A0A067G9N1_CITSI|nr:hypothetical protein CISIN_1g033130mg [Citrus sinensis]
MRAFGNRYHGVPPTAKFTNQSKWEGDIVSVLSKRRNCSFHMIDLIFGYVVLRVDVPLLIAYACFHRGFVGLLDVFHDQAVLVFHLLGLWLLILVPRTKRFEMDLPVKRFHYNIGEDPFSLSRIGWR